jgi:hypothetical protein
MLKKRVLVGLVLVCAASLSAQDSLRQKIEVDWADAVQEAKRVEYNSPTAAVVRRAEELSIDPFKPPPRPEPSGAKGWRDGAPGWFSVSGVKEYQLYTKEPPRTPLPYKGCLPQPLGVDYEFAMSVYTGPVKLTKESLWVPWPFALDVEGSKLDAPMPVLEGGYYEYQWAIDIPKTVSFEPLNMTGVQDWLKHMGYSGTLDVKKWNYTYLDSEYHGSPGYPEGKFRVYVHCGVNVVSGDTWFRLRAQDGDAGHDLYGRMHPTMGRSGPPVGFYVNAMYRGLIPK